MIYDCILLTDKRYLTDSTDPYKHNVFYEDFLVQKALENLQLKVDRLAWDDSDFNWSSTKCILFRTTWDYFDRLSEFLKWLDLVSQQTVLINSPILINWNLDKHYLLDLQAKGIQIPETHFISQGSLTTLKDLYDKLGWSETVLKPCVSGAGRHTYKLTVDNLDTYEPIFKKLIEKEAMMLQTFQHNVVKQGEISIMLFNGVYTHAVLKRAKQGDFRVQDDFGGSVEQYNPNQEEISFAIAAIKACPEVPLYARVDIFYTNDNKIALGEFELIEPELWFRLQPKAADLLAKAIHKKLVTLET